jgi:hemolysin III
VNAPQARQQSPAEEVANSVSHGIGFLLAVAALPILVHSSMEQASGALRTLSVAVFAATMMLLYLSSALFHGLPPGRSKLFFEKVDHAAIYLFIAGSYTPFAASALQGLHAWLMFALVWTLAVLGVVYSLSKRVERPLLSTGLYVAMGWMVLLAALPLIGQVSATGVTLLLAGGFAYTLGAALFLLSSRLRFAHLVWHLFVMAGSGLHFFATLSQA